MAVFLSRAGIGDMLHVPYKGGTALVAALVGGEVQSGWSGIPNVAGHIKSGKLRVLCVSTAQRSASLPDVPTAAELGLPGFDIATVIGLQAPAGLPRGIAARLQAAVAKALRERDVAERMANLGMVLREAGCAGEILATDPDPAALAAARRGIYALAAVEGVGEERLRRHFFMRGSHEVEAAALVRSELRAMVRFEQGNLLASQLGTKIGLDDAGLSESRALGGTVVGIGKYLSPRLYVSYGVSLLGTGQVVTLKYLLRKGFDIEIESSTVENRGSVNWRKEK